MKSADDLIRERRLDREDLQIQFDAALRSVAVGHFAAARAELAGAEMILNGIEKRRLSPRSPKNTAS